MFEYEGDYSREIPTVLGRISPTCESKSFSCPERGTRIFFLFAGNEFFPQSWFTFFFSLKLKCF